jgi:glutamate-1-semialdehyde 2,1-aminomutase
MAMSDSVSEQLFDRALRVMPGGVNSPVRAFRAVGGHPVFISRASGARVYGADGREYIDYVGSWGPAILGHAHPKVVAAIQEAATRGLSFGAPTELELRFAEAIIERYPSIELLRCVSSGTEATMSALRAARGFTGRELIVKFEGAYHGHADALLVKAGSGAATFGTPDSAGVTAGAVNTTLTLAYNDLRALRECFAARGAEIAAVIVEPVAGNMGCVPPAAGFLPAIIDLCAKHGAVSVFDEVITGCRLAPGGAQELYRLRPNLTCLGKAVGGGMPLAVYGGKRDILECVAPLGPVYQAGTLSGNPLAVTAGLATLAELVPASYARLEEKALRLEQGLVRALRDQKVTGSVQRVGSVLTLFFHAGPVAAWSDAKNADTQRFAAWHRGLIERGIYWPPAQFEAAFVSLAHDENAIDHTVKMAEEALKSA